MEAIIKNGSRQYLVKEGDIVKFDKMNVSPKAKVEFKEILALNDGDFKVGTPYIDGAVVEGEVIGEGREKKIIVFKKRRRKDSKRKMGFRRDYTAVKILKIKA